MKSSIMAMHSDILEDFHNHAPGPQQFFLTHEGAILANDHSGYSVQQNRSRTHRTRRERCIEHAFTVGGSREASGIFQGIHLAMQDGTGLLDAPIMSATKDLSLVHQD